MMVTRITTHGSNIDRRKNDKAVAGINFSRELRSTSQAKTSNNLTVDDLIGALANAYENKRARQASEWEIIGRQNYPLLL